MRILAVHPPAIDDPSTPPGQPATTPTAAAPGPDRAAAPATPCSQVTVGLKSRLRAGVFRGGPIGRRGANAPLPHTADAARSPADDDIDPDVEAILYDIH